MARDFHFLTAPLTCFPFYRVEFFAYEPGLRKAVIRSLKAELGKSGILGLGDVENGELRNFIEESVAGKQRFSSSSFLCPL